MVKRVVFLLLIAQAVMAQEMEIPLYEGRPPGSEQWSWNEGKNDKNSEKVMAVFNVVQPTLTVFSPDSVKANGTAIIICPGGGFHFLAIEHEGSKVAQELVKNGITVFLLKYRLVHIFSDNPFDDMLQAADKKAWDEESLPIVPLAITDANERYHI